MAASTSAPPPVQVAHQTIGSTAAEAEIKFREAKENLAGLEAIFERLVSINTENSKLLEEYTSMAAILSREADNQKRTLTLALSVPWS
ncbi:hypothetical protein HDU97_008484 [Phlyctochytrium planicorne]|nr:hypothetical protein HDU97_008484 [Phlyctochytrium planicorne]